MAGPPAGRPGSAVATASVLAGQSAAVLKRYALHPAGPPRVGRMKLDRYAAEYWAWDRNSKAIGLDLGGCYGQSVDTLLYVLRERTGFSTGTITATFVGRDGRLRGAWLRLDGLKGPSTALNDRSRFAR